MHVNEKQVAQNPRSGNSISWGVFAGSKWSGDFVGESRTSIGLVQSQSSGPQETKIYPGCISGSDRTAIPGIPMLDKVRRQFEVRRYIRFHCIQLCAQR